MEDLLAIEKHCIVFFFRCYNQKVFYLFPVHTCTLDNGNRQVLSCNRNFYFYYTVPCQLTENYFLLLYLLKHCFGVLLTFHENFNEYLYFHFLNPYRLKQWCLFRYVNRIFLYKLAISILFFSSPSAPRPFKRYSKFHTLFFFIYMLLWCFLSLLDLKSVIREWYSKGS